MQVRIYDQEEELASQAATIVEKLVRRKPDCVLGLAASSTPIPTYRELIRRHREEGLDFSRVTTFNLDEYVGLDPRHPRSLTQLMEEILFSGVNLNPARIHIPDGAARDLGKHCREYEDRIAAAGGIDLQILGIGVNGHIAFNEPGAARDSRTRVVGLTASTREANARLFERPEDVPTRAITMGVATILETRRILMLATGESKAEAVQAMIEEPPAEACPASWLQEHSDVEILLDRQAAGWLALRS